MCVKYSTLNPQTEDKLVTKNVYAAGAHSVITLVVRSFGKT